MRSDDATTRAGVQRYAPEGHPCECGMQECDWGEYVKFEDVEARIATLAAEVERLKGETQGLTPTLTPEEGRAVIAEWRRGGGVDSARLTVALWNAFESGEICDIAKVREGVEKLNRYDEPPEADGGIYEFPDGDYLNRAEVLALLDATRGET